MLTWKIAVKMVCMGVCNFTIFSCNIKFFLFVRMYVLTVLPCYNNETLKNNCTVCFRTLQLKMSARKGGIFDFQVFGIVFFVKQKLT